MARACPKCQRPNADTAAKCLYCSEPLPAVERPAEDTAPPASTSSFSAPPETSPRPSRYLVVLFPGTDGEPGPEDAKVEAFSRITRLGNYESRQHLRARRPRLFRRLEDEQEARALSKELARAEIAHYVVEEASMLALPVSRARSIVLHERHLQVVLDTGDGQGGPRAAGENHAVDLPAPADTWHRLEHATTLSILHDDLLLVVHGEITRERHHEERLGSNKGVSKRLTPGRLLHLYARDATVAVEIEPDHFDWAVLGEARTSSVVLNAKRFLALLAESAPVTIDGGFDDEPVVLSRSSETEDPSRALADGEAGAGGIVWDNEEQFRYFARWRYRLERYLATRAGSV